MTRKEKKEQARLNRQRLAMEIQVLATRRLLDLKEDPDQSGLAEIVSAVMAEMIRPAPQQASIIREACRMVRIDLPAILTQRQELDEKIAAKSA